MLLRWTALLLTALTGFTGLAYEVAWQKYLASLLGSHAEATASILGLFLGGLSLGYWLFGRLSLAMIARARERGEPARLLRRYGLVEAGIGLWVLCFPALFDAVQALAASIPYLGAGLGFAVDVGLSALLVLPPAVLMGGTVPFLTQALPRDLEDATRVHALVYGSNTLGAFAGALAAGFVLIPWLGLARVMATMGAINIAVGAIFVALDRASGGTRAPEASTEAAGEAPDLLGYTAIGFFAGFAMMALQAVFNRLGALGLGASPFTFSMIVAVFVACIALGSLAVSALPRIPAALLPLSLWALGGLFALLYLPAQDAAYWAMLVRHGFGFDDASFHPYWASVFGWLLAVIGAPLVLSGATLPLIFHALRDRFGDLGSVAGRLYAWNTVGSLLGALLGGYLLLYWVDLHHVYRIALAAVALAAVWATVEWRGLAPMRAAALGSMALLGIALLPAWQPEHLASGLFRARDPEALPSTDRSVVMQGRAEVMGEFLFHDDDPVASITVTQHPIREEQARRLFSNGKPEGSTLGDVITTTLTALIPALFAEQRETAFVIGYGTGITAGALADLDEIESVTVAEISPAVIETAPLFDSANQKASHHPKLEFVRSDAYRALRRSPERYDVIASEPSNPWVAGVEELYSVEFLRVARDKLRPGGVYGQWIHLYEMDEVALGLVLRSYVEVFGQVSIWFTQPDDLVILGFESDPGGLDLARVERLFGRDDFQRGLRRADIDSLPELLAHELWPLGVEQALEPGPLHTLHHPRLAYAAGRAFFRTQRAWLPFTGRGEVARRAPSASLLAQLAARSGGALDEEQRAEVVGETCVHAARPCATLLAAWRADAPDSAKLRSALIDADLEHGRSAVDPLLLDRLALLLGRTPVSAAGALSPHELDLLGRLFRKHYHHLEPFDPDALLALWEHCDPGLEGPEACREGYARAREMLGR